MINGAVQKKNPIFGSGFSEVSIDLDVCGVDIIIILRFLWEIKRWALSQGLAVPVKAGELHSTSLQL